MVMKIQTYKTHLGCTTQTPRVQEGENVKGDDPRHQSCEVIPAHRAFLTDYVPGKLQLSQLALADEITEYCLTLSVGPFLKLEYQTFKMHKTMLCNTMPEENPYMDVTLHKCYA